MKERRTKTRLVGRDQEVARLLEIAEAPATGAVLLTGPAGIGKSRLAEGALLELVSRGWHGVGLSATDPAGRVPYASLSALIPETLDGLRGDESDELTVLRAVEDALDLDGPRQVVLVIDDIASLDLPGCALLVHLATNRRLFIIASQAVEPSLPEALRRLRPAAVVEMAVGPLSVSGTAELAAQLLDEPVGPGLVRNLHTRTLGNPFFITELVDAALVAGTIHERDSAYELSGDVEITPALGRQILFRLGLLTPAEQDVLELLSLAGELDLESLVAVIDVASLEAMERRGLVRTWVDGRRMRAAVGHPLHAEAIVADMTPLSQRRRWRELVALMDRHQTRRDEDAVLRGLATLGSGQQLDAPELLDAAYVALRLDRVRDASKLAQRAHESAADEVTLTAYTEALIRQGRFVEAEALLARPLPADAGDWERLRRAIRRSSNHLWGFQDAAEAWRIDEECIGELTEPDAIDRVVAHQAWIEYCDGRSTSAVERTDALMATRHPDVRFAVAAARAPALILCGRVDEGAELAQRAFDEGWGADTEFGSHNQHLIALGFAKLYQGDIEAARFVAGAAIDVCRERQETPPLLFFLELAAATEVLAGQLTSALSYFDEALDIGAEVAIASSLRSSLAGATMCRAQLGQVDETAATWRRILDVPDAPGPRGGADVAAAEAWMIAATGDPAEAATRLRAATTAASGAGLRTLEVLLLFDLARLGYADADAARAASAAARECQGQMLPALARAIGAVATDDAGAVDAAAADLGAMGLSLWTAELFAAAADLWSTRGDQRAATASQRASQGARAGVQEARTPRLARAVSIDPLSRREREVAALAAAGESNSDIAARLHLSVRTVETHLQRVYRKLGISRRQDLADALSQG